MKNKIYILLLFVLPVILLLTEINYKILKGQYYLYDNYDGPYHYLMASLNLAQLIQPGFCHHPGIPAQIIGAIVIKFSYIFEGSNLDMVNDVFKNPEVYLSKINFIFTLLTSAALFVLGYVTFKKTKSISASIFLQFTPFAAEMIFYLMTSVIPEPVLICLFILFITVIIAYLNETSMSEKQNLIYALLFGFIFGLIISTKISILVIAAVPFILLKSFKSKVIFLSSGIFTFICLIVIVNPDLTGIWKFLLQNITHSGKYGSGPANFIDTTKILPGLLKLINTFPLFCISYLSVIVILIMQFFPKFKSVIRSGIYFRLLAGNFLFMSSIILIYLKQYEIYYLMPALMFSVITLFAVNSIFMILFPGVYKYNRYLYLYIIFIFFSVVQFNKYFNSVKFFSNRKQASFAVINYLKENYPDKILISCDRSSGLPTALYSGLIYAGSSKEKYLDILENSYKNYIYFDKWSKEFIYLNFNEELKNKLINSDDVIFHSFKDIDIQEFKTAFEKTMNKSNLNFEELFINKNNEKLIRVSVR